MRKVNLFFATIVDRTSFTLLITILIVLNCILIGVELDHQSTLIEYIQKAILWFFTAEIVVRWLGKKTIHEYASNPWNWFDIAIVALSHIPESWIRNSELLTVFRILRVFRIIRLVKVFPELQIITKVLFKSISSLFYVCLLMLIVLYTYSIIGVILFRGESMVVTAVGQVVDPFNSVPEALFSMFRVVTGEDWTDLRYDLMVSRPWWQIAGVTLFFMSFYVIAAFLLINLVVGAVCNNYDSVMEEGNKSDKVESSTDLSRVEAKLDKLLDRLDRTHNGL